MMLPRALTAIIADDEPLSRQALRRYLNADGRVSIVAEAADVPTLQAVLRTNVADVLFLDITMPGGSGLDVVPLLPKHTSLVFTTAHAEHAVTAFALDAADYLLKPFGAIRVRDALQRVRRAHAAHTEHSTTLLVRVGPRIVPVETRAVWRLEGADDCVRLVTATHHWLHSTTLNALQEQLDPLQFVRVHRRHIVNLAHVSSVESYDERRLAVLFPDGSCVVCSRTGSSLLRRF